MFPIRDSHPTQTFPFVNWLIIISNILVFIISISTPDFEQFMRQYAFIARNFNFFDIFSYSQIITSMWLHGGLFHLLSNMWFLHIFGDNVEDELGHIKYLLFYLTAGIVAVFAQYLLSTSSLLPLVGASGAISGVTGAYLVLFRHAEIEALVPTFFGLVNIIKLPAWFFLGYWFVIQVFSGFGSLAQVEQGGVAFFAHIGGFAFGYVCARLLTTPRESG